MNTRFVDKLAVPVILVSGGLVYLSEQFRLPLLIPIAFTIFGVFAILLGMDTFVHGRIEMFDRLYSRREYYSGISARLLGVIIFLFGAGILVYVVLGFLQPGMANDFLTGLVETKHGWGILLVVFGFFILLFGLIRLISGSAHSPEQRNQLVDLRFRIQGLIGFIIGVLLLVAGGWLTIQ